MGPGRGTTTTESRPRHAFRWLMTAQVLSSTGDQLLGVALALYVLEQSGSAALSAATVLARVLPAALLGAVAGTVVDRSDRRRLLVVVSLSRAALVLPLLLVVADLAPLLLILVVETIRVSVAQLAGPAVGASLPVVVRRDDLPMANARLSGRTVVVQLAAPTLGAALYAALGLGPVIALNATAYVLASCAWLQLPDQEGHSRAARRFWSDATDGLRLIRRDTVLAPLLASLTLALVGLSIQLAILVPVVRNELGGSATSVGALSSLQAVGGLLAAFVFVRFHRTVGTHRALRIGICGVPAATLAFLLSQSVEQAVPGVIGAGLSFALLTATAQVYLQQSVAPRYLGRVLGIIASAMALAAVIGTVLAIALIPLVGLRGALSVALTIESVGVTRYLLRTGGRRSIAPPQPRSEGSHHEEFDQVRRPAVTREPSS